MSCEWHKRVRWLQICRKNLKIRQMYIERLQELKKTYETFVDGATLGETVMEEDKRLRCPEDVESGEGHYDPEGPGDPGSDGHPLCAGCGCTWTAHKPVDALTVQALMPPKNVGDTITNCDGESYMKFKLHPDSAKTAPGPGGLAGSADTVTVKRATIRGVREDRMDPEAFLLETDSGKLHVTGVPRDELMSWLKEGQEVGDTGKRVKPREESCLDGIYECKGCGLIESKKQREYYKGPLYKDTLNDEVYCIRCSGTFHRAIRLPDGVIREDNPA
jgi:hypothetical protein